MSTKDVTIVLDSNAYLREAPNTVMRLAEALLKKGVNVNIWTFEEAVSLSNKGQLAHAEPPAVQPLLGESHRAVGDYVDLLLKAGVHGAKLSWLACILCVQERGVFDRQMNGVIIGTLGDMWRFVKETGKTLFVPSYR